MPSLLKTIKNALCRLLQARWAVAFWVDGRLMVVGNPYRDRWFADPFIVDADDKAITLLVEDFSLQTLKGSISELTIDRATWKICQRRPVLEEPLQLSFPYIVRREGDPSKTDQQLFSKVTAAVLADFSLRGNMHICSRSEIKKDSGAVFKVQIFAKSIL